MNFTDAERGVKFLAWALIIGIPFQKHSTFHLSFQMHFKIDLHGYTFDYIKYYLTRFGIKLCPIMLL